MLWTLLIWVVVGLVMVGVVWPFGVLVRAAKNGYDLKRYMECMGTVLDEDDADTKAKYNKFEMFVNRVIFTVLWPYKLIWITREFIPKFDERHIDLMIEKIQKEEHA